MVQKGKSICFYDDPDCMTWVPLAPWLRCCVRGFTMIVSARWLRKSSKFSEPSFEEIHRNIGSMETPKQVCIPPIIGPFFDTRVTIDRK